MVCLCPLSFSSCPSHREFRASSCIQPFSEFFATLPPLPLCVSLYLPLWLIIKSIFGSPLHVDLRLRYHHIRASQQRSVLTCNWSFPKRSQCTLVHFISGFCNYHLTFYRHFIIAIFSTIATGVQNYLFSSAAALLTYKLRSLSFKAILRQDGESGYFVCV
jgi:hypothetical protein